jgi:23S rRNA pseudouridine1911/1915/1917 synthase
VAETDDYLVVLKPAGVLTHPAPGSRAPALTDALLDRYPALVAVGQPGRPGIVHRLDRDVAGLLVVAKTEAMYDDLQHQFRSRTVKKVYTALVEGIVAKPEGTVSFPLGRSRTKPGLVAARPSGAAGRAAETRFTVVRRYVDHTLLRVELVTGRSHQIRAHCRAFGHPIVGDPLYGSRPAAGRTPRRPSLERPFLMATALGFRDRSGVWHEHEVPLDPGLAAYLGTVP